LSAPPTAVLGSANAWADGHAAGRVAAEDAGFAARVEAWAPVDDESFAVTPMWHVRGGKAVRRFPE